MNTKIENIYVLGQIFSVQGYTDYIIGKHCAICLRNDSLILGPDPALEALLNIKNYTQWVSPRDEKNTDLVCSPHCIKKVLKTIPNKEKWFALGSSLCR